MSKSSHDPESKDDDLQVEVLPHKNRRSWLYPILYVFGPNPNPPPPKPSLSDADLIPQATAPWYSIVTFGWLTPLLSLGFARPLQATDLYRLQDHQSSAVISQRILASYEARSKRANEYNARLARGDIKPGLKAIWWTLRGNRAKREKEWREKHGRKRPSLVWAMNDSIKWWFWSGGIMKVTGDIAQISGPLVVRALIEFASHSYTAHRFPRPGVKAPPIRRGIGLAIGLFLLQIISSLGNNHFFYRGMSTGVLVRGGLITAIYSRSLRLTSRARSTLTNGKLVNHISTDVSRIDFCAGFFHMVWSAPIQLIFCLIVLLVNLGPSALAGFGFFLIAAPLQAKAMKTLFKTRHKAMAWTDKRVKLLQELLSGMKVIKLFGWEKPYLGRIYEFRMKEMSYIRSLLLVRSVNNGIALTLPQLAAVLAFVTYSLSGHSLNPAIIFSSLALFNLLRIPLMVLPMSFGAIADAANAIQRLRDVFEAELITETQIHDPSLPVAVELKDASFTWDSPPPDKESDKKKRKRASKHGKNDPPKPEAPADADPSTSEKKEEKVFRLDRINVEVPRGILLAIVGPVGAGKSSLLQGMIGEMRKSEGTVKFGGSVAYCAQSAWIQNATVRENVCFGRPFEEEKYWDAIRSACLEPDLAMFPHGDMTEVGEKGISLSGGQKQRINICRAIYCDTDIQIFDDPLSALDAHVGKAVFQNVLLNNSTKKTRILVTHALHFLPQVDYILTMVDGQIAERGTYAELMSNNGEFSKFVKEFGSKEDAADKEKEPDEKDDPQKAEKHKNVVAGPGIMQAEDRATGAVSRDVYAAYVKAGKGYIVLPLLFLSLALIQGATVMSSYWLVYWQERKWRQPQGFYMGIYAALGVSMALFFSLMGAAFAFLTYFASQRLHKDALERVMHAPMSFFDTTPLGRIMNRFSKDVDNIDNTLVDSLRMCAATLSSIIGAIILISILLPWFLVPVAFVMTAYVYAAYFYRASARELKRLDAILRSSLYAHFSESLTGIGTIRAYGESERFLDENKNRVDIENRAYWITVSNQRWLGIRVDFLGSLLTLAVSLLAVGTRYTISPAQTGVVLSFILSIQQGFGWMVRQLAEVENNMNSVERIVHYSEEVEQEPPLEISASKPPSSWPAKGCIELSNVVLKYRPELPIVLKGISLSVGAGEKIGIVGRTGAGKTSIVAALYRLVELTSGTITIDGVNIADIGLADLRRALAIIPQDPLLFSGTLRSNLDPFGLYDDARLWDALKRSYLVDTPKHRSGVPVEDEARNSNDDSNGHQTSVNRFTLDTLIEDEGNNLSMGQRSLVSLARALVKDAKILVLDEATASVDYEADRNIQDTIAQEFKDRTILCIAHRLRTIISYDRICVLDSGQIAEFDTPANLYRMNGIFRMMCDRSAITHDDIQLAAKQRMD